MNNKLFVFLIALALLSAGMVSAVNLQVTSLEVNGHTLSSSDTSSTSQDYKRGDNLDITVCVQALADVSDAQIYADISGYTYAVDEPSKIHDMTDTFDLLADHSDCFDLNLQVPTLIDKDYFKLRITADDRNGTSLDNTYQLYLKGISRKAAVEVKDFSLDPQEIIAGRAFTGKVQIHNLGDSTMKDLKVTMSIPELNIQTSEYMDEIGVDKSKTFEELLLRIPECTKAGTYTVDIVVDFDNFQNTETTGTIKVDASDTCGATTPLTPDQNTAVSVPNTQDVAQGGSVVYPVMIQNNGAVSQTYTLSVSGASEWSTTRIDPSAVIVVPAGQSKTAYLYVSVDKDAASGDKVFTLNIESGTDSKAVPLVAKITTSTANNNIGTYVKALEWGCFILVVILIIVGLVIGFNKMKDNDKGTEPYY